VSTGSRMVVLHTDQGNINSNQAVQRVGDPVALAVVKTFWVRHGGEARASEITWFLLANNLPPFQKISFLGVTFSKGQDRRYETGKRGGTKRPELRKGRACHNGFNCSALPTLVLFSDGNFLGLRGARRSLEKRGKRPARSGLGVTRLITGMDFSGTEPNHFRSSRPIGDRRRAGRAGVPLRSRLWSFK